VASKKLSAAQEQALLSRLRTGPLPLWSTPVRKPAPPAAAVPSPA